MNLSFIKPAPGFRVLLACLLLGLVACDQADQQITPSFEDTPYPEEPQQKEQAAGKPSRKLIRTGEITFETAHLSQTQDTLRRWVDEFDAFISSERRDQYDERIQETWIIRIPENAFDAFLQKLSSLSVSVDHKQIMVEDVTTRYIDIESRLNNQRTLEKRYQELLAEARNIQEVLQIEAKLSEIREEIESTEKQFTYLRDQIQYSTLRVVFYENVPRALRFWQESSSGLYQGWQNLLWFLIGITHIWPFILIFPLVWVGVRRWRRKRKKNS